MTSEKSNFEKENLSNKNEFHPVKISDSDLNNDNEINNNSYFSTIQTKVKKIWKPEIYLSIIFIISLILYYLSLKGCDKPEQECLRTLGTIFFIQRTFLLIFSTFCTSIIISLSINKIISYKPTIYILIFYFVNFIYFRGMDLNDHGAFNTLGFIIFIPIFLFVNQIIKVCYLNYKRKLYFQNVIIFFIIFIPYIILKIKSRIDCNKWGYGLGGRKILDDKEKSSCYIKKPKQCFKTILDNKFDFNRIFDYKCPKKSKKFREKIIE